MLRGVAKYLEMMGAKPSFRSAITSLFFDRNGYFFDEITFTLSEQLKEKDRYFQILRLMAGGIGEITELERRTGIASGQVTYYLERLCLLGFADRQTPVGIRSTSKRVVYVVSDYFLRFYFTFMDAARATIKRSGPAAPLKNFDAAWDRYARYAFELVAYDHAHRIAAAAGHGEAVEQAGAFWQKPTKRLKGVQIDLVLECPDATTLICECKWSRAKTGAPAARSLIDKLALYPNPRHRTLKPVLVAAAGVTREVEAMKEIAVVTLEDLR